MSSLTFTLTPAKPLDIPILSQISQEAFSTDTHTRLKELIKGTNHAVEMTSVLSSWLSRPKGKCTVMKAVTSKGETIGWACWGFSGFEYGGLNVPQDKEQQPKEVKEVSKEEEEGEEQVKKSKEMLRIGELGAITSGAMREWSAKLTPPGSKCMILVAIPVLPAYQGKGVGSALIRWGTSIADEEGVYCWVSSSDGGKADFHTNLLYPSVGTRSPGAFWEPA
jgi:GNAT superfamily N-acetyltransferase